MAARGNTRGDPGLAAMASLQEVIRGNLNARHIITGAAGERLRKSVSPNYDARGGVPPPRGVGMDWSKVPIPPLYQGGAQGGGVLAQAESGQPVPSQLVTPGYVVPEYIEPRLSLQAGSGQSAALSLETAIDSVTGVVGPVMMGPCLLRAWLIMTSMGETGAAQWNLFRIDFSENNRLQPFAFSNDNIPTGGVEDGLTLWKYGAIMDQTDIGTTILNQGWARTAGSTGLFVNHGPMPSSVVIPYPRFFTKFYAQNDTAGLKFNYLHLEFQMLDGDVGIYGGTIVPRQRP